MLPGHARRQGGRVQLFTERLCCGGQKRAHIVGGEGLQVLDYVRTDSWSEDGGGWRGRRVPADSAPDRGYGKALGRRPRSFGGGWLGEQKARCLAPAGRGVRGWRRDGLGTGRRGGGARAARRVVMSTTCRPTLGSARRASRPWIVSALARAIDSTPELGDGGVHHQRAPRGT
jgi:hypothetical protein